MPMPQLKRIEDEPSLFELTPPMAPASAPIAAKPAPAAKAAAAALPAVTAPARSKIEKSATAHRTISEVAEELDVPQHVLRFWETKFTQLRPLKRAGGRRYYRTEDVALIRQIHSLLYAQGYTIKGAQKVLKDKTHVAVQPVDKAVETAPAVRIASQSVVKDETAYVELRQMLADLKALRELV